MPRLLRPLRRLRRILLARRRMLAGLCAALAVAAALQANAAPPPPRTMVLTAARDLAGGVVVRDGDLQRSAFSPDSIPAGTVSRAAAVGRTTAGPIRAGEALTDARLLTASLLAGYPGLVAVPVRIGDPGAVRLLRVGDRVDVLAADPQRGSPAAVLGREVPVLAIPSPATGTPGLTNGALVVLGFPDASVRAVAQASVSAFLSVAVTR